MLLNRHKGNNLKNKNISLFNVKIETKIFLMESASRKLHVKISKIQ